MAVCEDAPCCGCCGAAVWAAEARAEEEWREERYYDDYDNDGPDLWPCCGELDCYCDEEDEDEE